MIELEDIRLSALRIADFCDEEISIDLLDYIIDAGQKLMDDAAELLLALSVVQGGAK